MKTYLIAIILLLATSTNLHSQSTWAKVYDRDLNDDDVISDIFCYNDKVYVTFLTFCYDFNNVGCTYLSELSEDGIILNEVNLSRQPDFGTTAYSYDPINVVGDSLLSVDLGSANSSNTFDIVVTKLLNLKLEVIDSFFFETKNKNTIPGGLIRNKKAKKNIHFFRVDDGISGIGMQLYTQNMADSCVCFGPVVLLNDTISARLEPKFTMDSYGNYYVSAECRVWKNPLIPKDTKYDHHIIKYDPNGNVLWTYKEGYVNESFKSGLRDIVILKDSILVAIGDSTWVPPDITITSNPYYLVFLNANTGQVIKNMPMSKNCSCNRILGVLEVTQTEDLLVSGYTIPVVKNGNAWNLVLWKMSPKGVIKWQREYYYKDGEKELITDSLQIDVAVDIEEDAAGSIYLGGRVFQAAPLSSASWLMKVDSNGCITPGCTGTDVMLSPVKTATGDVKELREIFFKLYPNPATDHIDIDFVSPQPGRDMDIVIHNTTGQLVKRLDHLDSIGLHRIDSSGLPSGEYIVTLTMNGVVVQTEKVVIQK